MSYNSRQSKMKMQWRNAMLGVMEVYFPNGIPKGQTFVTLAERYMMPNGKVDPVSEIGMGLRRGLFTPDQVVCVDKDRKIANANRAALKLGIRNVTANLADAMGDALCGNPAFVSADDMRSARVIGGEVAEIMRSCNIDAASSTVDKNGVANDGQFDYAPLTCLFVNACMIHARKEYLEELPVEYFKEYVDFNEELRKRASNRFIWRHEKFFGYDTKHVTSATPMQSALLVKTPLETPESVKWHLAGLKAAATRKANAMA